jgi:hypothetical protein
VDVADVAAIMSALSDLSTYQATHGPGGGALTNQQLFEIADLTNDGTVTNADVQGPNQSSGQRGRQRRRVAQCCPRTERGRAGFRRTGRDLRRPTSVAPPPMSSIRVIRVPCCRNLFALGAMDGYADRNPMGKPSGG